MNEDAVSKYLSERGGNDARAKKLTAEQRKGIAKKAAKASRSTQRQGKSQRKAKRFRVVVSSMYEHLSSTAIDGAAFVRSVAGASTSVVKRNNRRARRLQRLLA